MNILRIVGVALALGVGGCAHQVTFDAPAPYAIVGFRQEAGVTAVIDQATLARKVSIRVPRLMHRWEAEPGDMLRRVAAVELPQMFSRYELASAYEEPAGAGRWIVLELAVTEYVFDEFHARVSVTATAYDRGRKRLMQKTYAAEGESQRTKIAWGNAYDVTSAIRQSSLDAYKKVFAELRADLVAAMSR